MVVPTLEGTAQRGALLLFTLELVVAARHPVQHVRADADRCGACRQHGVDHGGDGVPRAGVALLGEDEVLLWACVHGLEERPQLGAVLQVTLIEHIGHDVRPKLCRSDRGDPRGECLWHGLRW